METVKDFFQSIFDNYRERIKSPFIGSFIISYCIFNWRTFAVLFYSDWPIHCRIEFINENYCNTGNILIPLAISFIYILILPYFNLICDSILKKYNAIVIDKKNKYKIDSLIQKKDEAIKLREIADAQAGTSEIVELNVKIKKLNDEISELNTRNQTDNERWQNSISNFKNIEDSDKSIKTELQKEVSKLEKENKKLNTNLSEQRKELEEKLIPSFIYEILNKLTTNEINDFMRFYENRKDGRVFFNEKSYKNLLVFEMVKDNDGIIELTNFGSILYHYIKLIGY